MVEVAVAQIVSSPCPDRVDRGSSHDRRAVR